MVRIGTTLPGSLEYQQKRRRRRRRSITTWASSLLEDGSLLERQLLVVMAMTNGKACTCFAQPGAPASHQRLNSHTQLAHTPTSASPTAFLINKLPLSVKDELPLPLDNILPFTDPLKLLLKTLGISVEHLVEGLRKCVDELGPEASEAVKKLLVITVCGAHLPRGNSLLF
ncbi:Secretoglobin family 3A member 2 [Tupaia chinensis]|uniref:Secretoglobin family 3A member 2 n=1 Tax=Tupaia chinensis TaxID=246437 RepID=L9KVF2_TUPCH|nr:Secretoglobin family 3A member 2 [Tupaia chinensis]